VNAKQIWQATLGELQLQTSKPNFETWLRNTWAVSHQDDIFTIGAPSTFAKEWLETRFLSQIQRTLSGLLDRPVQVRIIVGQPGTRNEAVTAPSAASARPSRPAGPLVLDESLAANEEDTPEEEPNPSAERADGSLRAGWGPDYGWAPNPLYTFSTFVVGSSNQLAHAAALSVAAQPARRYNPLFLYGGVGLGKTHLLHAIAHEVLRARLRVLYVSSEQFTNDLVNAIKSGRTDEFRTRYRTADVLLIDDIQFIAGKESTQEEFFHTFNALHGANRQIVMSSDRPPRAMMTLEERLRSRFEWGLIADIQPPDLETRTAILQAKRSRLGMDVPDEVLAFIAQRVQSNIRELEGSLNRVVAYAQLCNKPVTMSLANSALADLLAASLRNRATPGDLLQAVSRYYKVDVRALRGKQRDKEIVLPRQVAMYIMHEDLEMPLTEIGRELGGRDHSTVLHGVEKIERDIESDAQLRRDVNIIRESLFNVGRA